MTLDNKPLPLCCKEDVQSALASILKSRTKQEKSIKTLGKSQHSSNCNDSVNSISDTDDDDEDEDDKALKSKGVDKTKKRNKRKRGKA